MTQKMPQDLRDMWTDAYKYHAAIETMGNTVADWEHAYQMAMEIYNKYDRHPLVLKLLLAVYEYVEQVRRPQQDGAGAGG